MVWGIRLGSYLFTRILTIKVDHRFDDKRSNPLRFGMFWLLQAITVWVVMLPVFGYFSLKSIPMPPVLSLVAGALVFAAGLTIEAVADAQKFAFKKKAENRAKFMHTGIWKYSRHPNYLGEMMVWWGISIPGFFVFSGTSYLYLVGAPYITLLLLFVSGIPLLEKSADEKWGSDPEYRNYKDSTPVLIPFTKR
jgi:steroid 5-alpha reductase family enzyme